MSKATRRFIVNKILEMLITLVVVTLISFLLVRLSPIDPAEAYARRSFAAFSFTDEQMEALREDMGLNDPLVMFNILSDILRRILQRDASAREGARL